MGDARSHLPSPEARPRAISASEATAHLLARASWSYSRASGPGGQRRDHAETRAELRLDEGALEGLPTAAAARIRKALRLDVRPLRLTSQAQRSREQNRAIVERRLAARVAAALAPRTPRRATAPSAGSVARRLEAKAHRGAIKEARRAPGPDD